MVNNFLILVRHGQSEWNQKNLFTGWVDVNLSEKGHREAQQAGLDLQNRNLSINQAFCSALKRSIHTLEIICKTMSLNIPHTKTWKLNERHYGALQGQNKQEAINQFGIKQVHEWRRSFYTAPPPLSTQQSLSPPEFYTDLKSIPQSESLKDTQNRVLPFWKQNILPIIKQQKSVLIVAHGNSLRALIKELENVSDKDICSIEIKTARPIIYTLDNQAQIVSKEIL